MGIRIISAELVRELLPMAECVDVMAEAMAAASSRTVAVPPRKFHPLTDNSGHLGLMPGFSRELGSYGAKIISLHRDNPAQGLPAIQGFVCLFEHATGTPVAIVAGAELTGIRTAAASGLATRLLAREDARSCGIFGTGVQAQTHIDAVAAVRPIDEVVVWGRRYEVAEQFAREQAARTGLAVRATREPQQAAACDVICTVTGSPEPILRAQWVQPGAHVNVVGAHTLDSREVDTPLVVAAAVYVDLMESTRNEGGDIMIPVREGAIDESHIRGELGELVLGQIPGRDHAEQITLYNSLGMTAQDLFAARRVYDRAVAENLGVLAEL